MRGEHRELALEVGGLELALHARGGVDRAELHRRKRLGAPSHVAAPEELLALADARAHSGSFEDGPLAASGVADPVLDHAGADGRAGSKDAYAIVPPGGRSEIRKAHVFLSSCGTVRPVSASHPLVLLVDTQTILGERGPARR